MKTVDSLKKARFLPLFYGILGDALEKTEERVRTLLRSENRELEEAALYLLDSGGKRLRPGLLLLSGRCGTYDEDKLIPLAAAVEIIHMASLVHDDIVDDTPLRRGKPTVAKAMGRETALLTGNFMLARAVGAVLSVEDAAIRRTALYTATEMCRGEFSQLEARQQPDFRAESYLLRVKRKTANLISAACEIGAHAAGADEAVVAAMKAFGEKLGIAFQITDDILDYTADPAAFGKAVGGDLRDGLATMPLICAWNRGKEREVMKKLFAEGRRSQRAVDELIAIVEANDGLKDAAGMAAAYIREAKEALTAVADPAVVAAFEELSDFVLSRKL